MCLTPTYVAKQGFVSCGHCLECLMKRSTEWSYRIMLESRLYSENCFITLTYNEDNLPQGASLKRMDLQKFIKRLRKAIAPTKIRYFYCGEYGSKGNRPHYHIIVFGWQPKDMWFWCVDNKKTKLFRSSTIEKLWSFGFSSVGDLNIDSAKYCAKYMQKALLDNDERERSFVGMSTRPGIAYSCINAKMLETGKIYYNGKYIKLPRYFLKVLEKYVPLRVAEYKKNKNVFSLSSYSDYANFLENLILKNKKFLKNFKKSELYKSNKGLYKNVIAYYKDNLKALKKDENMKEYFNNMLNELKTDYSLNYSKEFFEKGFTNDSLSAIMFSAYDSVRKSP